MKNSLKHLPRHKRNDLHRLTDAICETCDDVEMIVLFGSYARGDYKEDRDLDPDRKSGAASDYDILVVTTKKDTAKAGHIWGQIERRLKDLDLSAYPRLIAHDHFYLAKTLSKQHYFFSDIFTEGVALYDAGTFVPKIREKLEPEMQREAAQEHFDHWFKKANDSFFMYGQALKFGKYDEAAFNLHQAAERSYKALLLVHTNYTPYNHYLKWYDEAVREVIRGLTDFFPRKTKAAEESFDNFDYAYIGTRYDPNYYISEADLQYFTGRVKLLVSETEARCQDFIQVLPKPG